MRADDAVTRGFLRQNDLALVFAQYRPDSPAAMREDAACRYTSWIVLVRFPN